MKNIWILKENSLPRYSNKKTQFPIVKKCIRIFNEAQCEYIAMRHRRAISMSSYLNCPVRTDDVCIKRLFIAETHHGLIRHGLAPLGILENLYVYFYLVDECDYYDYLMYLNSSKKWRIIFQKNFYSSKNIVH